MIARFNFERKVRCHNIDVEKIAVKNPNPTSTSIWSRSKSDNGCLRQLTSGLSVNRVQAPIAARKSTSHYQARSMSDSAISHSSRLS
jgi:hypothetical protein